MTNTLLTLLSADRLKQHYEAGHWRGDTIFSLAKQHAERVPEKFAFRDRIHRITYSELVASAERLAGELHRSGVRSGQRVAVWHSSRIETAIAVLACSRNGLVCCPSLHRNHAVADVVALLRRMRATAFIGEEGYGADKDKGDIFSLAGALPSVRYLRKLAPLTATDQKHDAIVMSSKHLSLSRGVTSVNSDPDRVVYLAFTSGTTGEPRGVMHSDNTLLSNARAMAADWHMNQDEVIYTLSPLSHNLGFGAMITSLLIGGELVVHDLPQRASLVDRILDTGATFLFGVPTHAIDLLDDVRNRGLSSLGLVKGFRISGAAASKGVVTELLRYGIKPQSGYGMTEACSHQYTLPDDDSRLIVETSGRACDGYEIKIWSPENPDVEVAVGEVGEIGGRGASLMLGYFADQTSTEDSFNSHGWFMTGDLGWIDENGYLRVTGRKKDLIIRGGHNIYPARIETLAMQHEAIERAAALPVADSRLGEKVCLAVMTRAGKRVSGEEILDHLDALGLPRYDMPEYFLALDEIPLTTSGKILKRDLVKSVQEGRIIPTPIHWKPGARQ